MSSRTLRRTFNYLRTIYSLSIVPESGTLGRFARECAALAPLLLIYPHEVVSEAALVLARVLKLVPWTVQWCGPPTARPRAPFLDLFQSSFNRVDYARAIGIYLGHDDIHQRPHCSDPHPMNQSARPWVLIPRER